MTSNTPPDHTHRSEMHFRRIDMHGYQRSDGLFEVEARVTDHKPVDYAGGPGARQVPANEAIHDMGVRLVFDEDMVVREVTTFTDAAPYAACPAGGKAFPSLKGLRMGSGWTREVRKRLGGAQSCTHLMQLLTPLATTAYQTLGTRRILKPDLRDAQGLPVKIDSCFAYAADGDLVRKRWPQFAKPPYRP